MTFLLPKRALLIVSHQTPAVPHTHTHIITLDRNIKEWNEQKLIEYERSSYSLDYLGQLIDAITQLANMAATAATVNNRRSSWRSRPASRRCTPRGRRDHTRSSISFDRNCSVQIEHSTCIFVMVLFTLFLSLFNLFVFYSDHQAHLPISIASSSSSSYQA